MVVILAFIAAAPGTIQSSVQIFTQDNHFFSPSFEVPDMGNRDYNFVSNLDHEIL